MTTKELIEFIHNSLDRHGEYVPCIEACLALKGGFFTVHYFCSHADEQTDLIWHETQGEEEYITSADLLRLYPERLGNIWGNVTIT